MKDAVDCGEPVLDSGLEAPRKVRRRRASGSAALAGAAEAEHAPTKTSRKKAIGSKIYHKKKQSASVSSA